MEFLSPPDSLYRLDEKTGKAAETRLKSAAVARQWVEQLAKEDKPRSQQRALVKGLIDGNPPYNEARHKAAGRGWEPNLNFMEGEAMLESARTPYFQLFDGVEFYTETRTAFAPEHPDHEQWNRTTAEKFTCLLNRWDDFRWNIRTAQYQMLLHGTGIVLRDNKADWRFRSLDSGAVKVPQNAPSTLNRRIPHIIVQLSYRPQELYNFIRNERAAAQAGWNVAAIKNAVKWAMRGLLGERSAMWASAPWEYFQRQIKNNDLTTGGSNWDMIPCAHLLVQEFPLNGKSPKISHFIVTESPIISDDPTGKKEDDNFIFSDPNAYERYEEVLNVFFLNDGDGTWHSVRGMAEKAFKHLSASNQLKNRMLGRAFYESSVIWQANSTNGADKLQLLPNGMLMIIPPGGELKEVATSGRLDSPMAVDRLLTNNLANNVGMFFQRSLSREDGRGEMPTARQIDAQVTKEATLSQGQIGLHYQALDKIYDETFRRVANPNTTDEEAKRFQKECEEAGVPKEALANMNYVRANRASGYGSPQMRQMTDQQMLPFLAMLPEEGKQHFLEDAVGAIKGAEKVRRYVPRQRVLNQNDWMAGIENAAIAEGKQPLLTTGQDDVVHLHSHLQDAADTLEPVNNAIEQGQNDAGALQKAYQYLQIMGAHIQAHLDRIQSDPSRKGLAALFKEQLGNLVAFSGKLRSAIIHTQHEARQAQMEAQQATALGALDQAKLQDAQTETQIKWDKAQNDMRVKSWKTAHQQRLQAVKTTEQIRQQRMKELTA